MIKTITKTIFVASDGKEFDTIQECKTHEASLVDYAKIFKNGSMYWVNSNFESTEGRGYDHTTYIIAKDASYMDVLDYCFRRFGEINQNWYAGRSYHAWVIGELNLRDNIDMVLDRVNGKNLSNYEKNKKYDLVLISTNSKPIFGLPAPFVVKPT